MRKSLIPVTIFTLGLAACGSPDTAEEPVTEAAMDDNAVAPMEVRAMLMTADGQEAGTATAMPSGDTVAITFEGMNLPAGTHGVHVHMTGTCEAPAFTSAGGHWNPTDQAHGLEDPDGQHAGDMPNLEVGEDGTGSIEYTLAGGATFDGLMDADGSAFIVHAGEDDQMTDPSGDSGDRIACGVFEAAQADAMAGDTATM